jgi:hypothetical protein
VGLKRQLFMMSDMRVHEMFGDYDLEECGVVEASSHTVEMFREMIKRSGIHFCVIYQNIYTRFTGLSE